MTIYYENTEREIFDMSDFPVAIEDITPLYGRKWKYDASDDKTRNRSSSACGNIYIGAGAEVI